MAPEQAAKKVLDSGKGDAALVDRLMSQFKRVDAETRDALGELVGLVEGMNGRCMARRNP